MSERVSVRPQEANPGMQMRFEMPQPTPDKSVSAGMKGGVAAVGERNTLASYRPQLALDFGEPLVHTPREVTTGPAETPELRGVRLAADMFRVGRDAMTAHPDYAEFHDFTPEQWRGMDEVTYDKYEGFVRDLNEATRPFRIAVSGDTFHEDDMPEPEYAGAVGHIRTMQTLVDKMWDNGLSSLYPEGTTVHYAKAQVINHDLERFMGLNGTFFARVPDTALPLTFNERPSEVVLGNAFPGLPLDDLHDMSDVTIRERMEDPTTQQDEPLKLVMKVMDVFGKPNYRDPDTFFTDPKGYQGWVAHEEGKGSMPFPIPAAETPSYEARQQGESGKIMVTAQDYARVDSGLVLDGLAYMKEHFKPGFDFNKTLMEACTEVSQYPTEVLVKDFGRAHDLRNMR